MSAARVRIRLGIAYDGTQFAGWAKQPGLRTVQGALEDALDLLLRRAHPRPVVLTVAGRTDAGVHAVGQVAHLDLEPEHVFALMQPNGGHEETETDVALVLRRRMNGILHSTPDVMVTTAEQVSPEFDARFSATWRRYRYRIADRVALHDPLRRFETVAVVSELDVDAMHEAAQTVLGLRDFATFCRARPHATTVRELLTFNWHRDESGVIVAELQADAFCHSMVRALVGGCVAAGLARFEPVELESLQRAAERSNAFATMPAHGLTLVEVGYPDPAEWGSRAEIIRARRSLDE